MRCGDFGHKLLPNFKQIMSAYTNLVKFNSPHVDGNNTLLMSIKTHSISIITCFADEAPLGHYKLGGVCVL